MTASTQPAEQSGVVVPKVPTEAMRYDGDKALANAVSKGGSITDTVLKIYEAMLAAAPAAEQSASSPVEGDLIDGTASCPVGTPEWCTWATTEIERLRATRSAMLYLTYPGRPGLKSP